MSRQLAERVLKLTDKQSGPVLEEHHAEIDNEFAKTLIDACVMQREKGTTGQAAIDAMRILYRAGKMINRHDFMADALLQVGLVYQKMNDVPNSRKYFQQSLNAAHPYLNERIYVDIAARAHWQLAQTLAEVSPENDEALSHLSEAKQLLKSISNMQGTQTIQKEITRREGLREPEPFQDEIEAAKRQLAEIHTQCELQSQDLSAAEAAYVQRQQEAQVLEQQIIKDRAEQAKLRENVKRFQTAINKLKAELVVLQMLPHAPLWVAAARAELASGQITTLTLPLLERLSQVAPEYADSLILEIRARQGVTGDALIDLNHLNGQDRFFAGLLNASALQTEDWMQATEVLLDAWETYLPSLLGRAS